MIKNADVLEEITIVRERMRTAQHNFDNTLEPQLINSYIYELKSLNERLSYLFKLLKE